METAYKGETIYTLKNIKGKTYFTTGETNNGTISVFTTLKTLIDKINKEKDNE